VTENASSTGDGGPPAKPDEAGNASKGEPPEPAKVDTAGATAGEPPEAPKLVTNGNAVGEAPEPTEVAAADPSPADPSPADPSPADASDERESDEPGEEGHSEEEPSDRDEAPDQKDRPDDDDGGDDDDIDDSSAIPPPKPSSAPRARGSSPHHGHGLSDEPDRRYLWTMALAALGVVYGDIGTSPLYALRECFHGPHAITVTDVHVLGVLSLVFWSLILVISLKYLAVVMRADNQGEGGILALMALVVPEGSRDQSRATVWLLVMLGIFGAALLYGDGMITPAISVLSAVEGLSLVTPRFSNYVVPLTVVILIALFAMQHRGTAGVGRLFGPITLVWFLVLAVLGVASIVQTPGVLEAASPHHAVRFFADSGWRGLAVMGTVFLVVTGGEALYADMGHFGVRPIRLAWFRLVLPALMLNYFGQGALLLRNPGIAENPFFHMTPRWALLPMVGLATVATIIASQAVITGSFSLTWQAIQLGYLPRMEIRHTSEEEMGQIYIPQVNWLLLLTTLGLVLGFRTSSNLAAAYGVAVTTTMVITTILLAVAMRKLWRWGMVAVIAVAVFFIVIDFSYFGANLVKVPDGGWVPLVIGVAVLTVMTTWRRGRRILADRIRERTTTLDDLRAQLAANPPLRAPGTAVFLTGGAGWAPPALLQLLRHANVLHQQVVFFTVANERRAYVPMDEQLEVHRLGDDTYRVTAHCGYMERPHVPRLLERCAEHGLIIDRSSVAYVLGRETLLASDRPGMAIWREKLFAVLARNAGRATAYFGIPSDRVLEIGSQIEL
jgi:KUP system potassium uptake protein